MNEQRASSHASLSYHLSLTDHAHHLIRVVLSIEGARTLGPNIDLRMAAWSPGSYLIRDYARYVRDLEARAGDREVPVLKLDKQTWRLTLDDACDQVQVTYRVYGHDLTVRTNHLDESHALVHGPATFLMVDGLRDAPCRVNVELPAPDWILATGLEPAAADGATLAPDSHGFVAKDLDQLLDSPIHASHPSCTRAHTMDVAGTRVRLVVWGEIAGFAVADMNRLAEDLAAITSAHAARFGGRIPCDHYTFVLMLTPGGYGGLEHKNSSINMHDPWCMESKDKYYGLLELLSHEFFHVWNGKRIFPPALSRFDYSTEGYTRCLWVMEGLTSYYDRLTALHASDMDARFYLGKLADEWGQYQGVVGRHAQSLEEASFDAWIKLYKPDESNVNTTVSYYLAGGLAALVMDLEIRARTEGARTLEHVLAHLWAEYGQLGVPYPEDVQPVFERATGLALGDLFDTMIRGRKEPELARMLEWVGLGLEPDGGAPEAADPESGNGESSDESARGQRVWLGAVLGQSDGRVSQVLDESPAARAGLSPGDLIIALDGWQARGRSAVHKRLSSRKPGDEIELALFRRNRLTTVRVALEAAPPRRYRIVALDADPAQRARYAAWLGEEHPGKGKLTAAGKSPQWI